jgi:serine phosphatase RsbU (regulator of sigma subunit)
MTVPMIFSPIQVNQSKIGVINVTEKRSKSTFTSGDLKLLNSIASMAAIAIFNNRLLKKVLESERLKRDLHIAENIQLGMLPTDFPLLSDLEIYGKCRSAKNVGGDYFDFQINDQKVDLLMADVSGHNVGAALMMANTRSVLKSLILESPPVSEILRNSNHLLYKDMIKAGLFISIFFMRYNRETRKLSFANGGHHPVFWYQTKQNKFLKLDAEGLLLGILPDVEFEEKAIQLERGDLLVMYTDGLIESQNDQGEYFGYERLKKIITHHSNQNVYEIVDEIFTSSETFSNSMDQSDDITIQIMKVK